MSSHWFGVQQRDHQRFQPTAERFDWLFDVARAFAGPARAAGLRAAIVNRYDNSVIQTDAVIGRLFAVLEEKGYLDDAIVAITADHGEGLGERGEDHYGHGMDLYQEQIRIPMLFGDFAAGDPALASETFASPRFAVQSDIGPTILDRLGAPVPDSWDGVSVMRGTRERSFHAASVPTARSRSGREERVEALVQRSSVGDLHKRLRFIERRDGEDRVVRRELYELHSDPGELHDLASSSSDLGAALDARLDAHFADESASEYAREAGPYTALLP
jgi:arylsulfatase A-like enzyme